MIDSMQEMDPLLKLVAQPGGRLEWIMSSQLEAKIGANQEVMKACQEAMEAIQ
jgi:hypothetical protein